ncbi:hypothetical protein [Flavobacterium gilvum]|uniref:Uncharacterized protein n=1 Tax=Flavobacterium gilvum TaxID=1492737 RepID=A0AAC9I978_9FLAO|nr:hypothetical protein [Flavobacterium gilvum]AOW10757.1 hypothetical protein EM308_15355 [Flavobacterium gilvum]KFC58732.1 hypothetical protein FEM08_24650 [Flavobacterium gilvum]
MQTTLTQEETFDGRTSTELALGCFAIGTVFLILFLTLQDTSFVLIIGFLFIILATILNGIMLCHLLYHFYILPQQRKYIGRKILMLLANIPVAFLYYSILFYFNNNNSPF